ncbi:MAG: phosphoglycerate kinase, partial [Candidatus Zixiibacteriota bacterium]
MNKVSVSDVNFRGQKVLLRVDFNVPLNEKGQITDDRRIREALPTIRKILDDGGIVIACSHLGRPKGKPRPEFSLRPVAARLAELLDQEVFFAEDCIGPEASNLADKLEPGECLLLENLRFHPEEETNDPEFSRKLASLANIYVNDAFGSAHRAHASTEGVTRHFSQAVAGLLLEKELQYLGMALKNPRRPFAAILGGAKISGKIDVIKNLLDKIDDLYLGGGMIFTFGKAMGYEVGDSLVENEKVALAGELLEEFKKSDVSIHFPMDIVAANEISDTAETKVVPFKKIPVGFRGLDIGPDSINSFSGTLMEAKTIFWNGPMGVFEHKSFSRGTLAIALLLAELTDKGATTIVGGGDSAAAVSQAGVDDRLTHISTGGGASLE